MEIEVINRQRRERVERERLAQLARATLESLGALTGADYGGAQVTIAFVRDAKMRELNRDYRGKDYATDVLSFGAGGEAKDAGGTAGDLYLGDVVIATDTAARQARAANLTFEREVEELVIHGVLHLCGYDHETDGGEMNRLEKRLRRRLLK